ncbi:MAG: hypothetical protein AB8B79_19330 [Granulosicoccus sp.]
MKNSDTEATIRQGKIRRFARQLLTKVTLIAQIHHERERLAQLSERELLDMGIDKIDASQESKRDLLDLPSNRVPEKYRFASNRLPSEQELPKDHSHAKVLKTRKLLFP